jgi:hypothetical protein
MKTTITLISLFCSLLISSQIPKKVDSINKKIFAFYEGQKLPFIESNIVELTQDLQNFYNGKTEYYRYYNAKKKVLKGIRFYTDNDIFSFFDNRDHEYTGGLRLEFITDFFGLKLFSFRRDHKFLSYQSLMFGFELYTPNVIDVKNVNNLDERDRPFASFQYLGRSRNIISLNGNYRSSELLKIGLIGGDVSRDFQRLLHRDITDSDNNNGWDYQIANGGRLAIQYDLRNEWQYNFKKKNLYFNYGFETKLGFEKTSITPTIALTNKSFFEKNPHYAINSENSDFGTQKWGRQFLQTVFFEAKLEPEIVFYNSMLQGYVTKNKEFKFNDSTSLNEEIPVISDINRLVGRFSFGFGFRNFNSTFLFEYYLQTPEYNYSWKNKYFHRYGRISFTMNI